MVRSVSPGHSFSRAFNESAALFLSLRRLCSFPRRPGVIGMESRWIWPVSFFFLESCDGGASVLELRVALDGKRFGFIYKNISAFGSQNVVLTEFSYELL